LILLIWGSGESCSFLKFEQRRFCLKAVAHALNDNLVAGGALKDPLLPIDRLGGGAELLSFATRSVVVTGPGPWLGLLPGRQTR
jgi:hypothetical protein